MDCMSNLSLRATSVRERRAMSAQDGATAHSKLSKEMPHRPRLQGSPQTLSLRRHLRKELRQRMWVEITLPESFRLVQVHVHVPGVLSFQRSRAGAASAPSTTASTKSFPTTSLELGPCTAATRATCWSVSETACVREMATGADKRLHARLKVQKAFLNFKMKSYIFSVILISMFKSVGNCSFGIVV